VKCVVFAPPPVFIRGHFNEICIAALLTQCFPRHVAQFHENRPTHVEKCEFGEKKIIKTMRKLQYIADYYVERVIYTN